MRHAHPALQKTSVMVPGKFVLTEPHVLIFFPKTQVNGGGEKFSK